MERHADAASTDGATSMDVGAATSTTTTTSTTSMPPPPPPHKRQARAAYTAAVDQAISLAGTGMAVQSIRDIATACDSYTVAVAEQASAVDSAIRRRAFIELRAKWAAENNARPGLSVIK